LTDIEDTDIEDTDIEDTDIEDICPVFSEYRRMIKMIKR